MKKFLTLCSVFLAVGMLQAADIYLASDSSCANYTVQEAPLTGWGQMLQKFCKPGVKVDNRAVPGGSAESFIRHKYWEKLIASVNSGDFVVIQFGHNDQKNGPDDVKITYPACLKKMISEVRAKGGIPVLATCTPRAYFKRGGSKTIDCGLQVYHDAAIRIGKETGTEVIDIYPLLRAHFDSIGEAATMNYFMYTSGVPGADKVDRSHLKKNGAEMVAELFVNTAKKANSKIANAFK